MLVVTRKLNEEIVIGDNIIVTLIEVKNGKARIGITAPRDVPVDRREVREAKDRDHQPERKGP